jgi:hypothetical protein
VLSGRRFEHAIANGSYPVDIHHADGAGITFRYLDGTQRVVPERGKPPIMGRRRDPLPTDPTFYQVPLRSLLQQRVPNLMLAGRMMDADKTAFSAVHVMVNPYQTGKGAGVAAGLALDQGIPVRQVDPVRLRKAPADGGSMIIQARRHMLGLRDDGQRIVHTNWGHGQGRGGLVWFAEAGRSSLGDAQLLQPALGGVHHLRHRIA